MQIKLDTEDARLELNVGDLVLTQHRETLKQEIFLLVSDYDNRFPYALINMQENRIEDSYKAIDALIKRLKSNYKILQTIPSHQLELRRII